MVKVVSLFLIGMLVLAMFGRLRVPKFKNPLKRKKVHTARKCSKCGAYLLDDTACECGKN